MSADTRQELFAVTSPGLEEVTSHELRGLGIRPGRKVRGGVEFRGSMLDLAKCHLWLRTASRILVRLGAFDAPGRRELAARASRLPIEAYLLKGTPVHVEASSAKSRLYHTGLIAEVLHEALASPEAKEADAPTLFVRFEKDRCTISVDASGELLHKRGYHEETSHAPLRETLAAGMLLLTGYNGSEPFLDPMCGSGTIAIEAALIAMKRAPGLERSFAMESFPSFDHDAMAKLKQEARDGVQPLAQPIFGSDIHAGSLAAAGRNAGRANATITFERADVATRKAPAPTGLIVTNPPYGKRIGREEDESLPSLAMGINGPLLAWRAAALLPQSAQLQTSRKAVKDHKLDNGGIPVHLVEWAA